MPQAVPSVDSLSHAARVTASFPAPRFLWGSASVKLLAPTRAEMGNICRPPPPVTATSPDETIPEMEEDTAAQSKRAWARNGASKGHRLIDGSGHELLNEVVTNSHFLSWVLHGYVPVTPISASSYDAIQPEVTEEEGLHMRIFDYREERGGHGESVYLHLYDLNDTFAHMNSVSLDLLGLGGALHVGVEILGNEWSFGMQGVSITTPKENQYYTYRQTVTMGRTALKRKEVGPQTCRVDVLLCRLLRFAELVDVGISRCLMADIARYLANEPSTVGCADPMAKQNPRVNLTINLARTLVGDQHARFVKTVLELARFTKFFQVQLLHEK
eukprot:Skav224208  [mRNA]  locus=scaffold939:919848:932012:- [translate_table: standard]